MKAAIDFKSRARRISLPERGGTMAILEFGPADRPVDVVFAHATGFNGLTYRTILGPLAHLRILAPDLRGHGATDLPTVTEARRSWSDIAADHLALLEALDLRDVVLAGHSMGGTISLLAAAEAPERVRALALFDPVVLTPELIKAAAAGAMPADRLVAMAAKRRAVFSSREAAYRAYHGRGAFRTWPDAVLADYVAAGFKDRDDGTVELACTPQWEASTFVAQANDTWSAFERTRCPISIFRAEIGSTCQIDDALGDLAASGRIQAQTLPGATHFVPMERPDVVAAALQAAVRSAA